jgi:sulfur carrier protein ThiS
VKLYATLQKYAPKGTKPGESFEVELENSNLSALITQLGIKESRVAIVFLNGNRITNKRHSLQEGDLVVIFPPIGGGK